VSRPRSPEVETVNNRMSKIMKLINASSLYASIHQEIYNLSDQQPSVYLEMVHNTDDDSLSLIMIKDIQNPEVLEFQLGSHFKNMYWDFICKRYGGINDSILGHIETLFRTNEFHCLISSIHKDQEKLSQGSKLFVPG
jgi:hypothetical protein